MKSNISFQELAKLGMEVISKPPPITLEMARLQCQMMKNRTMSKKTRNPPEEGIEKIELACFVFLICDNI